TARHITPPRAEVYRRNVRSNLKVFSGSGQCLRCYSAGRLLSACVASWTVGRETDGDKGNNLRLARQRLVELRVYGVARLAACRRARAEAERRVVDVRRVEQIELLTAAVARPQQQRVGGCDASRQSAAGFALDRSRRRQIGTDPGNVAGGKADGGCACTADPSRHEADHRDYADQREHANARSEGNRLDRPRLRGAAAGLARHDHRRLAIARGHTAEHARRRRARLLRPARAGDVPWMALATEGARISRGRRDCSRWRGTVASVRCAAMNARLGHRPLSRQLARASYQQAAPERGACPAPLGRNIAFSRRSRNGNIASLRWVRL